MTTELWRPSDARIADATLSRFMQDANQALGLNLKSYDDAWNWSVQDPAAFWRRVWDFCDVAHTGEAGPTLVDGDDLLNAKFFPDARLNYAENMLRGPADGTGEEPAIIFHAENGVRRELSWNALRDQVARTAQGLKALGVGKGDRVAGFMPNMPETVIAMLATASLGGIWSSCSPDFGVNGVYDRFGQIEPKVLFTANGYHYNGKAFGSLDTVAELIERMPSVQSVIVVPHTEDDFDLSGLSGKGLHFTAWTAEQAGGAPEFTPMGFNDPLYIMFSSGTTGVPKCIVHKAGGVLLQHLKEHRLQCDVKPGDRVFYFTTCGWMMWNWLVSGLAAGACIVLFDGSPFYPDGNRLSEIAAADRVTHFGTSAKYIDACAKDGIAPMDQVDLSTLRTILSTGSPLSPDSFDYIYARWKRDVCLSSIAGGTDIIGCFVGGNPIGPVYRGQSQKRHLGMDVRVYDDGDYVLNQPGELVCAKPHPSQPWGFWNDADGARYRAAYFEDIPGVWRHGDLVELTDEGGMIFHGRSDATLNPGGVRIGTAEIYRQVERIPEILESIVVGQNWDSDVRVVLFVRLRDGVVLDDALIKRIKTEIRTNATPRHVPALIIPVTDIPRTKSGKIVEIAVRDVIHGRKVKNVHALANPDALDLYRDLDALQA